ncbi:hypothetical protein [Massilia sp. PWRC2]|uniref:hypothetical protein n=1 Tax=Massilia sp. PWRC2 TaxID=2804626 RepID=UPI003CF38C65
MGTNDLAALTTKDLGVCLVRNFHHDDGLSFDLYGTRDDDGEVYVGAVMIAGTKQDISVLLSSKQLDDLSHFVEMTDCGNHTWAGIYRSQAQHY